jgi:cation diffusion facilitator family transporter
VALLSDALHNLSDVSTSLVVFLGSPFPRSRLPRRIPTATSALRTLPAWAAVILASAVFAAYQSYQKLLSDRGTTDVLIGMAAAVIGMLGNLAVAWYKRRVARQIGSVTMQAEAQHSWLDTASSFGALVRLIGVALGYRWADPIAGFAVTLFILHVFWEVTSEIVNHLMDGMDPEQLAGARAAATSVPVSRPQTCAVAGWAARCCWTWKARCHPRRRSRRRSR